MKFWSSLVVLALTVVITIGLPRPDQYAIPQIPHQSRAQYYVLHNDGTYKYGYDTGEGLYETSVKMGGNVNGFYGFTDPNGKQVRLDYTAGGDAGFVPTYTVTGDAAVPYSAPAGPASHSLPADVPVPVVKSAAEEAHVSGEPRNDASYNFGYETADSHRKEEADADLNVKGEYGFVADDGVRRQVNYVAGSDTGFVATADFLPKAPEVPSVPHHPQPAVVPVPVVKSAVEEAHVSFEPRNDASYSFSYETADSHRKEEADADLNVKGEYGFVADDGVRRQVNYVAGSDTGFVATADFLPKAPEVPSVPHHPQPAVVPVPVVKAAVEETHVSFEPRNDASYSFSYQTADSHRKEEADADLNVKGEYGFVADDGVRRQVNYVAGSDTGFVATADFLPKAPEVPSVPHHPQPAVVPIPVVKSAVEEAHVSFEPRNDASYSFSYQTADSHRKEEADADLNVKGEYGFVADDGVRRQVNYVAGSDTGFVATADFLPKAPEVPSVPHHPQPAVVPVPVVKSAVEEAHVSFEPRNDASYSFSYQTADSHRKEEADADLNVKGEYGFVADDGVRRQVNYVAGSDTGFVATADFLPKAPEVPSVPHHPQPAVVPVPVVKSAVEEAHVSFEPRNDASYSFSYETADSHRKEEADADLNVKGEYGFVADDGVRRQVNYVAGSGTGFVATADFLPKAPEVPSVPHHPQLAVVPVPVVKSAVEEAHVSFEPRNDASYNFAYETADSHRKEEADADLNVKGEYGFVADDGVRRQVNYIAGSDTGFVATADFLPKSPESPSPLVSAPVPVVKSSISHNVAPVSLKKSSVSGDPVYRESVVGNVLLRQYSPLQPKTGYVYTAI